MTPFSTWAGDDKSLRGSSTTGKGLKEGEEGPMNDSR